MPLALITISLVPLNEGLEAPGFTASVEPMIQLPPEYHHNHTGSLLLVTVIPQAPILTAEWLYAHIDHAIQLQPQSRIVGEDDTAQNVSRQNYNMLRDSETTAVFVGLKLAGLPVEINTDGVAILSILPTSPSAGILQPDDIITELSGNPIVSPDDLMKQLSFLPKGSMLNLKINRNGQIMDFNVPSMDPAQDGGSVRIGISIAPHITGYALPFPIKITARKVNGGPSAGLMFTLGVYDVVTGKNLTGGRTIAGTGTIDIQGSVGPIGGVQQKVVAAERAGAEYFLVPAENYADAAAIAKHIKVIKVTTAQEAIDFLMSLPPIPTS
jgi:PDZ domain-containing protein